MPVRAQIESVPRKSVPVHARPKLVLLHSGFRLKFYRGQQAPGPALAWPWSGPGPALARPWPGPWPEIPEIGRKFAKIDPNLALDMSFFPGANSLERLP